MYYGTPSALIGWHAIQHNHNWANGSVIANNKAYGRTMATTITPTWQDVNRINYFTPRFAGLQIGVGYAPKLNAAQQTTFINSGPTGVSGICGYNNATNINNCPTAEYACGIDSDWARYSRWPPLRWRGLSVRQRSARLGGDSGTFRSRALAPSVLF
jgi:hypothetical protein